MMIDRRFELNTIIGWKKYVYDVASFGKVRADDVGFYGMSVYGGIWWVLNEYFVLSIWKLFKYIVFEFIKKLYLNFNICIMKCFNWNYLEYAHKENGSKQIYM